MTPITKSIIPVVSIHAALTASLFAFGFRQPDALDAQGTDAATTAFTSKILENSQFAHRKLDNELAGKFLDRYLDALDGNHLLFLKSDLAEFARYRPTLAEATRHYGDSDLAHLVFERYLKRLDQRVTYIKDLLAKGDFDFSGDESFEFDRKDAERPADIAAARSLWRQQLRHEYLQEKLAGKKPADIAKALGRRAGRMADAMGKLERHEVLEIYLEALAQVYDPHSDYMGPKQLESFQIGMNLSLVGIGATLQSEDGYCKIKELVRGGPADRSGQIRSGDRIVGVSQKAGGDFTDLIDLPLPQAVDLIRGKKGSSVYLNIIPADSKDDSARKLITIVREEITLEDQQAKAEIIDVPDGNLTRRVGVIDLPAFYAGEDNGKGRPASASADVHRLINKLKQENVAGIILDLRRNGGGSLQEAIDLTGLFIPSGPVVQTRNLEGRLKIGRDRDGKVAWDGPLVVLTSRFSASASEIVAGALQDYGRALVVGDTSTFGKGTVQTIIPLARTMEEEGLLPASDPGALKVTISKFYLPSGKSTQLEGVKADIVIPSLTDFPEISEADLGNALPWDTIRPSRFTPSGRVNQAVTSLRSRSERRIAKDADFKDLASEIACLTKARTEKSVSLNEAARKKEKAETDARTEAARKARLARATSMPKAYQVTMKNVHLAGPGELVQTEAPAGIDESADDIVLKEARNILLDYAGMLRQEPMVSRR